MKKISKKLLYVLSTIFIICGLLLVIQGPLYAEDEEYSEYSGKFVVIDEDTKSAISGANITIGSLTGTTDSAGEASFTLPKVNNNYTINAIGYYNKSGEINTNKKKWVEKVKMKPVTLTGTLVVTYGNGLQTSTPSRDGGAGDPGLHFDVYGNGGTILTAVITFSDRSTAGWNDKKGAEKNNLTDSTKSAYWHWRYNASGFLVLSSSEYTDTVSGSITFTNDPGTPTASTAPNYVRQTVGEGTVTVDASSVAGAYATVTGSGGQTVTIEKISSATASAGGFSIEGATTYVDLHLDNSEGVEQIQFTILGGAGVPMWWNGSSWIECSNYAIDAAGNVTVTITGSTIPSLSDLTGTVFTVVGKPAITVLGNTETTPVEIETVRTNQFTCWQVFVNDKNNFQLIFFWSYKNNNWLKIYDMNDKLVFQKDLAYNDPTIEVSLPDGMYKVKTYHDNWDKPLQEFIIGKP